MRSNRTAVIIVGLAILLLGGAVYSQSGAPARHEFQGKILAVSMRSVNTQVILEQARIQPLGGQPFLVGRYLDDPIVKGPRGRTTWLALIDVLRIVEFDDVEQLKKADL